MSTAPTEHKAAAPRSLAASTALATALACIVLLPLLGHRTLAMWDEGIYAEVSREMLHRNPLVPTWNLQPWLEKPPLMLWITAGFFRLFGVTEFWARAGSAFSGVATVALLHRFLARRFTRSAAWIGAVVLLSSFGFLHVCRAGEMDGPLTLFEFIAVLGLVRVHERDPRGWWAFWIGFAAALMTKGAASIVLPITAVCALAVDSLSRRHLDRTLDSADAQRRAARDSTASPAPRISQPTPPTSSSLLHLVSGFLLFLALVLPWHIAMLRRFGPLFTHEYLGLHVFARAYSQIEGHHTYAWYYIVVLLVSAPPWVLLYPSAVTAAFRRPELRPLRAVAIFALAVFIFFTVVRTRLPHYVAPVYPAFSLLVAVWLDRHLRALNFRQLTFTRKLGLVAIALACWGAAALVTAHTRSALHSPKMSNGVVTPDTHEPATLLKRSLGGQAAIPAQGPLLLWAEPPVAPITTAAFYARRRVVQVEAAAPANAPEPDIYTWNPVQIDAALTAEPKLTLIEKPLLEQLPPGLIFTPIQSLAHWELGTLTRWPQSPAGLAGGR